MKNKDKTPVVSGNFVNIFDNYFNHSCREDIERMQDELLGIKTTRAQRLLARFYGLPKGSTLEVAEWTDIIRGQAVDLLKYDVTKVVLEDVVPDEEWRNASARKTRSCKIVTSTNKNLKPGEKLQISVLDHQIKVFES